MDATTWIYLVAFVIGIGALAAFVIHGTVAKTRWGINFSRVTCPVCQARQPLVRTPADKQEGLWGGYTCNQCGTKMDKWGRARD